MKKITLTFCITFISVVISYCQESNLWNEYINSSNKGTQTLLADYSHAGYHYCEKELPIVTEKEYTFFNVVDFGAIPNDGKSDRKSVLQAIEAAHKHSSKVVVYFPEGKFRLNDRSDFGEKPLVITKNNLVIKGAGQHLTELYFDQPMFMNEGHIKFIPNNPYDSYWRGDQVVSTVSSYPKKGGYSLKVSNSSNLSSGDIVNIDADLNITTDKGKEYFTKHEIPEGIKDVEDYFFEIHQVDKVINDVVFFKEPIHLDLAHMENIKLWRINDQIEESGIQDLTISGNLKEQFKHHKGSRFLERYDLISFTDAKNCWASNLRLKNYSDAISLYRCISNSILNINLVGNTGHNSIGGSYSYGNLIAYVRENTETHHGLGGHHSLSNTVFLRCNQYDGLEAHCSWPRASLYDLNEGGFRPRPGGAVKFPHHGKDLCFWNWNVTRQGSNDFWPIGSNYGYFMPFIVAGLYGENFTIADMDEDLLAYESVGSKITSTESLFEAQLEARLGALPTWLSVQSAEFEAISRHSSISITSPYDFDVLNDQGNLNIKLGSHPNMDRSKVKKISLWVSDKDIQSGFELVASHDGWTDNLSFNTDKKGVIILKTTLLNVRNELEESAPITVFIGNPDELSSLPIAKATCMPHATLMNLYGDFVAIGGGEAGSFPNNSAMEKVNDGTPFYLVEEQFYQEQLKAYEAFGQNSMKPVFENTNNIEAAEKLIDGITATTINNIYGYVGTTIQFDLGKEYCVSKMDLLWKSIHTSGVKLEIQTSCDAKAWYSMVNDEPLWDFGVQRIGETLSREQLPGSLTSSIYFPQRRCRYIRLLAQSFPNGKLGEIKFYGSKIPLLKSLAINGAHPANWEPNQYNYSVLLSAESSPEIIAIPENQDLSVKVKELDSLPGTYEIRVFNSQGAFTIYNVNIEQVSNNIEDFEHLPVNGSYDGTFTGNNNIDWSVNGRIGEFMGSGKCSYFYPTQKGIESQLISGGLSEISFEVLNYRHSGNRHISVYINDELIIEESNSNSEKYIISKSGLQYNGEVIIKIKNTTSSSSAIAVDNISWTGFAPDRNAYLQSLKINGSEINNFAPTTTNYNISMAPNDEMPEITGIPQSESASLSISYPETLPGEVIIKVISDNGDWLKYIINLDTTTDVQNTFINQSKIYPNPTKGLIQLSYESDNWETISVFDIAGKLVCNFKNTTLPINISSLPNGVYYIRFQNNEGVRISQKVVKE